MSDSDNEWGFFVDLENYSKYPALISNKPFCKYFPKTKLYVIQESEEIYYSSELKELEENIYSNSELKENEKPTGIKEKIQYYVSLCIMITGFTTTILLAYYDII
jgi:hypothetical protein